MTAILGAPFLFAALVDDAGLFPPAELTMKAALDRHRGDEARGNPVLTGRFVCPVRRVDELLASLGRDDRLELALVAPLEKATLETALASLAADWRVELAGVEGVLGDAGLSGLPVLSPSVACSVEVPLSGDWPGLLASIAAAGHRAKVRCGGARPELFPTAGELGDFVHRCAALDVPFKATAGLHHALPYRDEDTGFSHHGFLNLLLAACRAASGASSAEVTEVLGVTDPPALVAEAEAVPADRAREGRALFASYGSCSTSEPIEDLAALGLVEAPVHS